LKGLVILIIKRDHIEKPSSETNIYEAVFVIARLIERLWKDPNKWGNYKFKVLPIWTNIDYPKEKQNRPVGRRVSSMFLVRSYQYPAIPLSGLQIASLAKPPYMGDSGLINPHKLYKNRFTSYSGCYNLREVMLLP
jgi:hypothetical protein